MSANIPNNYNEYKYLVQEGTPLNTEEGQILALKEDMIITFPESVSAIIKEYNLDDDKGEVFVPVVFDAIGVVLINVDDLLAEQ